MKAENLKLLSVYRPSKIIRILTPLLNGRLIGASTESLRSALNDAMGQDCPSENDFLIAYYAKRELDSRTQTNQTFRAKLQAKLK